MLRVRSALLAPLVIAFFVLGIGAAMLGNVWTTESTKVPATFTSGEFAGEYNPADIRGSYSFADIDGAFGVPADVLARAFGVANPTLLAGEFQAKELEEIYGTQPDGGEVGTDSLRLFVALYTGLPYLADATTRLPEPALGELEPRLAPADIDVLKSRLVSISALQTADAADESGAADEEHAEEEQVVKGRTTFGELLDWGLPAEQIELVLGMPMGPRAVTVRDFLTAKGMEFSEYRAAFQDLLESAGEP